MQEVVLNEGLSPGCSLHLSEIKEEDCRNVCKGEAARLKEMLIHKSEALR